MVRAVTTPAFEGVAEGDRGGYEAANEVISKTGAFMPAKKLSETDKVQVTCPPKTDPHVKLEWWIGGRQEDEQEAVYS